MEATANLQPAAPAHSANSATAATSAGPTHAEIREQQRRSWNRFSPGWEKWDSTTRDSLASQGEAIIAALQLSADDRVLDIACGTGEPSLSIAAHVPKGQVTGSDLSSGMLDVAKRNAERRGVRNFATVLADACDLPFADASFDAVSCRLGFMFFPDMLQAAQEMLRVLKPGGTFAATVWGGPEVNPWVTATAAAIKAHLDFPTPPPGAPSIFRCAAPGMLAGLLDQAGFGAVNEQRLSDVWEFKSFDEYWQLMNDVVAPVVAVLEGADKGTVERITQAARANIEQVSAGATTRLPAGSIIVSARKPV